MIFIIANSHCIRISGIGNYMYPTYMLTSSIFLTDFHLHFKKNHNAWYITRGAFETYFILVHIGFLCFSFLKKVLSLWIAILYSSVLCKIILDLKDFLLEQAYSNIQYMYKNILIATSLIMNSHEQQSQFYSLNLNIVLSELSDIYWIKNH